MEGKLAEVGTRRGARRPDFVTTGQSMASSGCLARFPGWHNVHWNTHCDAPQGNRPHPLPPYRLATWPTALAQEMRTKFRAGRGAGPIPPAVSPSDDGRARSLRSLPSSTGRRLLFRLCETVRLYPSNTKIPIHIPALCAQAGAVDRRMSRLPSVMYTPVIDTAVQRSVRLNERRTYHSQFPE
jgi:hypothetical protein